MHACDMLNFYWVTDECRNGGELLAGFSLFSEVIIVPH